MAFTVSQTMSAVERLGGGSVNMYTIVDTSNYVSEGLDVSKYIGVIKVVIPNGLEIYNNTNYNNPDITVGLGSRSFPLPTVDGVVIPGDYIVTLSMKNTDTSVITVNTTTYSYLYDAVEIDLSLTADGFNSTLRSEDLTDYGTLSINRLHSVTVPVGSGISDDSSTSALILYSANIWSGDYVSTIVSSITYTNGSLTVVDEIQGEETLTVYYLSRDTVFEAVTDFNTLYNETLNTNPILAKTYAVIFSRVIGYLNEYNNGVTSNDGQRCYNALNAIVLLLSPDFIDDLFTVTEEIIPFDFRPESEAEVLAFIQSLTATSAEINVLHGLSTEGKRILHTNNGAIVTDADFTYDENGVDIPAGTKYRINGVAIDDVLLGSENTWIEINTFEESPVIPTVAVDTDNQQAASTEFVINQASDDNPLMNDTVNAGTSKRYSRKDHVHPKDTTKKTDSVTATDKVLGRSSSGAGVIEEIACTAAGRALIDDASAADQRTTIGLGNVTNESKATMFTNAALTGNPTAPTQASSDISTRLANTEFVSEAAENVKKRMGLYTDSPTLKMTVIRNPQMDNSLPISGKEIFKVLSTGAFTTSMIGKRFKCTDVGSGTRDFRAGTTVLLKHQLTAAPWVEDLAADTPLIIDHYYTVVAAGTPDNWGSTTATVLTPEEGIEADKWYVVQTDTVTYNGTGYAASTYDDHPYDNAYAEGENCSPIIFKGISGVTTYTGDGTVYELNYLVCNSSTGNGTTSGTITLNWLPNMYELFNPVSGQEWALHAVTYGGVTRDKTLKITGGNYLTKTLNFTSSNPSTFTASNFTNRLVALYNPYNSSFDVDFSRRFVYPRPSYAVDYDAGTGLFKRKTDGEYCAIILGVTVSAGGWNQLGYMTTSDFITTVHGNNGKPIIDGKFTDTYLSSGNLTVGYKYKIIATEVDHFGTGKVVGDFFVAGATTACDASNIVRLIDPLWYRSGVLSSITYVGQAHDGKHIWEGLIYYAHNETLGRFGRKVEFLQFDETFSDEHFRTIPIDLDCHFGDAYEDDVYMLQYPYYTYYGGKHRIAVLGYAISGSSPTLDLTNPMPTYEYVSSNGKYGAYTERNLVFTRSMSNDAHPCSRDIEYFHYFTYNLKLWALTSSTAISAYCGFDAGKREVSLWRFSDEENKWYVDSRSPVIINPIYSKSSLWNLLYSTYHLGMVALTVEEGVLHILLTANDSSNNYTTFHGTLDMKTLGIT